MTPDFVVVGDQGQRLVAIEVKAKPRMTEADAVELRQGFMRRGLQSSDFFLLVSQATAFLWGPPKRTQPDAPPDLSFSILPVLKRYGVDPSKDVVYPSQLELLIGSWIHELAHSAHEPTSEPEVSLDRQRFLTALRSGHVVADSR